MELNENREEFKKKNKSGNLKTVLISGGIGLIIGCSIFGAVYYNAVLKPAKTIPDEILDVAIDDIIEEGNTTISISELEKVIESASELVSEKYHYRELHKEEKEGTKVAGVTLPGTEELTLIVYEGTVRAGIEVSEIAFDSDDEKKILTVTMPEAKILSHEIDESSIESYDVKTALFSKKTYEDYAGVIAECKTQKEEALAKDDEFLKNVQADAKNTISTLLIASGVTKDYTIIFS
ncbi:MAG: DUF4230 domain-containing protein [Oscillospiraceae bacterium]|nr:DUF4230 domain-containing protein [Oscillospiraceae bacterium]